MIPLVMSIIAKTETFQRDMARARGQVGTFGKSVRGTTTIMTGFSRQLMMLAGVGGGLYTLQRVLRRSVGEFASFEEGIAKVSTMLDDQSMRLLPEMDRKIRDMAMAYGEAKGSMVTGLYDILSAQVKAADSTKLLETAVRSAKGGFTESATTTKALIQILKAYNWQINQVERVSDIMHATVKQGRFTFEEYASEIGDIIGLAAFLDIKLEAVGASIATMTKAGLSADKAMTALKNILNQFIYPTKEARQAAAELGFTLDENSVKGDGLIKIMQGLSKANAKQLDTLMPSIRGLVGFATQLKNASEVAKDYETIINSTGLTQRNFEKAMATTQTQINKTREAWRDVYTTIGEDLAPALNKVLGIMNKMGQQQIDFGKVIEKNAKLLGYAYGGGAYPLKKPFVPTPESMGIIPKEGIEEINRRLIEVYGAKPKPEFIGPPKPTEEELREIEKKNYDIAQSYVRMYDAIDSRSKESFEWKKKLIDAEYDIYLRDAENKDLVDKLRRNRQEQLAREQALEMGGPLEGIGVALYELNRDLPSIAKLFHDLTITGVQGLVDGLNEALWKTRDLDEAMKELGTTMAKMATQWLLQQAVVGGLTGIGGALGIGMAAPMAHSGGRVGSLTSHRFISPTVFTGAPRYHDLRPGETAVIAQDDEVISRPVLGGSNIESLLLQMLKTMQERQTINATIVDKRDVVTGERMEGREGERWTMGHVRKNS